MKRIELLLVFTVLLQCCVQPGIRQQANGTLSKAHSMTALDSLVAVPFKGAHNAFFKSKRKQITEWERMSKKVLAANPVMELLSGGKARNSFLDKNDTGLSLCAFDFTINQLAFPLRLATFDTTRLRVVPIMWFDTDWEGMLNDSIFELPTNHDCEKYLFLKKDRYRYLLFYDQQYLIGEYTVTLDSSLHTLKQEVYNKGVSTFCPSDWVAEDPVGWNELYRRNYTDKPIFYFGGAPDLCTLKEGDVYFVRSIIARAMFNSQDSLMTRAGYFPLYYRFNLNLAGLRARRNGTLFEK